MELIAHRINTVNELSQVPKYYGVEVDLRDYKDRIILEHDPFKDGENFEEYLKHYNHGTMILNIKSERIEFRVIELLKAYNIKKYIFLDSSFPMIYLLSQKGEKNIALRFSELEGLDTIVNMQGMIDWVWIDCFTKFPLDKKHYDLLLNLGCKICLCSPDLLGRHDDIINYQRQINDQSLNFDAVCTKLHNMDLWKNI